MRLVFVSVCACGGGGDDGGGGGDGGDGGNGGEGGSAATNQKS